MQYRQSKRIYSVETGHLKYGNLIGPTIEQNQSGESVLGSNNNPLEHQWEVQI